MTEAKTRQGLPFVEANIWAFCQDLLKDEKHMKNWELVLFQPEKANEFQSFVFSVITTVFLFK